MIDIRVVQYQGEDRLFAISDFNGKLFEYKDENDKWEEVDADFGEPNYFSTTIPQTNGNGTLTAETNN